MCVDHDRLRTRVEFNRTSLYVELKLACLRHYSASWGDYANSFFTILGIGTTREFPNTRDQLRFLFLNLGHFLDHFLMLIFATAAALRLTTEWGMSYAELIPHATPGLVAFGVCTIPAGWLADKWSRQGMMVVFFIGIGVSSVYSNVANTPLELAFGLTLMGVFAAIGHPVGLAMVVQGREKRGVPLAVFALPKEGLSAKQTVVPRGELTEP